MKIISEPRTNAGRVDFHVKLWNQTGLFYTAISRVKTGSSLYLRNFNSDYILANEIDKDRSRQIKFAEFCQLVTASLVKAKKD